MKNTFKNLVFSVSLFVIITSFAVLPLSGNAKELDLFGQPQCDLKGIDRLYVTVEGTENCHKKFDPITPGFLPMIESEFKKANIKFESVIGEKSPEIPEYHIRIYIAAAGEQKSVLLIQCYLLKTVYLEKESSDGVKANIWRTESFLEDVENSNLSKKVSETVSNLTKKLTKSIETSNSGLLAEDKKADRKASSQDSNQAEKKEKDSKGKFVASKNGKVFHKPDCGSAARISAKNLVSYTNREEAVAAGKRPCKQCNP